MVTGAVIGLMAGAVVMMFNGRMLADEATSPLKCPKGYTLAAYGETPGMERPIGAADERNFWYVCVPAAGER